jgi:NifB/MoaA-like Fe-S oxidoreductase
MYRLRKTLGMFIISLWVENFSVAERALKILPHVRTYVENIEKNKKLPESNSFKIVRSAITDPLLPAKLAFFQTIASDVEQFLTQFQSNAPLAPLLHGALLSTPRSVMTRFVKENKGCHLSAREK